MAKSRSKRVKPNTNQQQVKLCSLSVSEKEVEKQNSGPQQNVASEQKHYNFRTRPGQANSGNDTNKPPANAVENVQMTEVPANTGGSNSMVPGDDIVFLPPCTEFELQNRNITGSARRKAFQPRRYQWPAPVPSQQQNVVSEQKRYNFRTRPGQAHNGNETTKPPGNTVEDVQMKKLTANTNESNSMNPDGDIVFLPPYTEFEIQNRKITGSARRKAFQPRRYQWPAPVPKERYRYMRDPRDPFWKPINRRIPEYPLFSDLRQPFRTHPNGPYSSHVAFLHRVQRGRGRPRKN
ncbi:hypothetical protein CAEBREN_01614 [Caenorhabditis brenneri]|uniref:Uncharacterized protein n=1 Tax=Caenorhabditis brenneri TaxID=135651 RepID=G0N7V0_CAEBE|nr:hypothetical protein CAEBREN_01614 [Caenorhabditis brenneri]